MGNEKSGRFSHAGESTLANLRVAAVLVNDGAAGNAAAATAEKGLAVLQASGQALAALLREVRQLDALA